MPVIKNNYASEVNTPKVPLMIGCSGGGGHIAAIKGILEFLIQTYGGRVKTSTYKPVLYAEKQWTPIRNQIQTGSAAMEYSVVTGVISRLTNLPILPASDSIQEEIIALNQKETAISGAGRGYIDMLLDVYPAGYESAAIWNILQRQDRTSELKKLIKK